MAVREILLLGNPLLRKKCEKVKDFSDRSLHAVVGDLRDTLAHRRKTHGFGRGIAAPQIGIPKRIIFINVDEPRAMINPRVIRRSRNLMTLWDDCFSFPDILAKVRRQVNVTIEFQDETGKRHTLHAAGRLSELLQHEIDHIDGILAIDRAIDSKHIVLRTEWDRLFRTEHHPLQL